MSLNLNSSPDPIDSFSGFSTLTSQMVILCFGRQALRYQFMYRFFSYVQILDQDLSLEKKIKLDQNVLFFS